MDCNKTTSGKLNTLLVLSRSGWLLSVCTEHSRYSKHLYIILALGRLKQGCYKFEVTDSAFQASLSYRVVHSRLASAIGCAFQASLSYRVELYLIPISK